MSYKQTVAPRPRLDKTLQLEARVEQVKGEFEAVISVARDGSTTGLMKMKDTTEGQEPP